MSHLTLEQIYRIEVLLSKNYLISEIASVLSKDRSFIYREIRRNCDKRSGVYRAKLADRKYRIRNKEKPKLKRFTSAIEETVTRLLKEDYSPEQITGYCVDNNIACVSKERIYQYIWTDKKNNGHLYKHLRNQGRRYRNRGNIYDSRGILKDRNPIDNRPKIVEEKTRFGDFELDTIIGKNHQPAISDSKQ